MTGANPKDTIVGGIIAGVLIFAIDMLFGRSVSIDLTTIILYPLNGILLYYFFAIFKMPYSGIFSGGFYGIMIFYFTFLVPAVNNGTILTIALQPAFMQLLRDILVGLTIYFVNSNIKIITKLL